MMKTLKIIVAVIVMNFWKIILFGNPLRKKRKRLNFMMLSTECLAGVK